MATSWRDARAAGRNMTSAAKRDIDGEDSSDISPKAKELVEIAEQYNGVLSGYVISVSSGQPNPRISLNGFTITCSNKQMRELKKKLREAEHEPDVISSSKTRKGESLKRYTFLWD